MTPARATLRVHGCVRICQLSPRVNIVMCACLASRVFIRWRENVESEAGIFAAASGNQTLHAVCLHVVLQASIVIGCLVYTDLSPCWYFMEKCIYYYMYVYTIRASPLLVVRVRLHGSVCCCGCLRHFSAHVWQNYLARLL